MKKYLLIVLLVVFSVSTYAQSDINNTQLTNMHRKSYRKNINLPNIEGYETLKCDFHINTMFSDGVVWPTVRVMEAWEEGLDAISITDHIEHIPHKKYLNADHNASYEIAKSLAEEKDIILIRGGEVTRDMPPGHFNGLFLKDVNKLDVPDAMDALREIKRQGGFVLWNHPGWLAQSPDTTIWHSFHRKAYEEGLINGIEVFNEKEWYPIAMDWCIDNDITVIGNTDIHDVCGHYYDLQNGHRPMTLVFAKERTQEAIKEALFAGRTLAWFDGKLAGKEAIAKEFFLASLKIRSLNKTNSYEFANHSAVSYTLILKGGKTIYIPKEGIIVLSIDDEEAKSATVTNVITRTGKNLVLDISLP